jgi:hypothetical protein
MKKRYLFLGIPTLVVIIVVAWINLNLAKVELAFSLKSFHLVNLQALTSELASEYSGTCRTVENPNYRVLGTKPGCAAGVFRDYPREYVSRCEGIGGTSCRPGSRLVYYKCDNTIESESDDRSTAYCPSN